MDLGTAYRELWDCQALNRALAELVHREHAAGCRCQHGKSNGRIESTWSCQALRGLVRGKPGGWRMLAETDGELPHHDRPGSHGAAHDEATHEASQHQA